MSYEGMDVDQARGLARQFDANANALAAIAATVTGLAADLAYHWRGPVSAAFERDWSARQGPALHAAAQSLSDLHARLVVNIDQQVTASAGTGGSVTGGSVTGGGGTLDRIVKDASGAWNWWGKINFWPSVLGMPVDLIDKLSSDAYVANSAASKEYNQVWQGLIKLDHNSAFLKFHESPALRYIHDLSWVQKGQEYLGVADRALVRTHLASVLGPFGMIMGASDAIVNGGQAINDLWHGHYNSAIMHLGTVAEDEGGVAGLVGGFSVRLLAEDYELGKPIQWSQLPSDFTGGNFQRFFLPSLEAAPGQALGPVVKALFG